MYLLFMTYLMHFLAFKYTYFNYVCNHWRGTCKTEHFSFSFNQLQSKMSKIKEKDKLLAIILPKSE